MGLNNGTNNSPEESLRAIQRKYEEIGRELERAHKERMDEIDRKHRRQRLILLGFILFFAVGMVLQVLGFVLRYLERPL